MKILYQLKKISKEELENIFHVCDEVVKVSKDSLVVKSNKNRINELLTADEEVIDCLLENDFDEGIYPELLYRQYLSLGISFISKIEDDRIVHMAIESEALDSIASTYTIQLVNSILLFNIYCPIGGWDLTDYDSIYEVFPKEVEYLIENRYFEVKDYDEDSFYSLITE